MKKMKIVIDADYLIFQCTEGAYEKENKFANEQVSLKPYKKRLKQLVKDIESEIAVELLGRVKIKGKPKLLFSDPNGNFRYELQSDYKGQRTGERSALFYELREWAHKKYGYLENLEADDGYGYYMGTGKYIGATFDKDCYKGLPGIHFNVYHTKRDIVETSIDEARRFNYLQALMGDPTDNIKGIPRVGEKTAVKLLDEFGWTWKGVVKSYESKGLTKDDAILTMRLVLVNQWNGKKLKLFKG